MKPPVPLLSVRNLSRNFVVRRDMLGRPREFVHAVDDVSFEVDAGTTLGIVGESGSGKSTLGRLALRLIEADDGRISFAGRDLRALPPGELRSLRSDMTMIFQDPYSALDPRWTVGRSVAEPLRVTGSANPAEQRAAVVEMLGLVGLDADVVDRLPGAFSGGQRQRLVIARALITRPRLVFCDEPVSALDVSTRAQVLGLLRDLQRDLALAYLFVSHDLGIVEAVSDRIAVMYLGSIVEVGPAGAVAHQYRHPYTASLVSASPAADPVAQRARRRVLLAGEPPSPVDPPSGCAFHPRCPLAQPICAVEKPALKTGHDGHAVACHVTAGNPRLAGEALLSRMTSSGQPTLVSPQPVAEGTCL
ncbi:MAG: transporter ATP-binding protein [Amycolatopsis sp.]|uniref:ABC transporter ATP-binding protein n=1 Tax=Amycolatopsis sp. TaxID=37632 RepID=UPI0026075DD8|nr:oligopeptide/dipeptide ABC transporter ATP-binding protein [Amycolatopsis sp.]MCU1679944.1 transporter ATP-binding protein [Amycolatopsis sp.]